LAKRESWLRALGRDLQILATGYEVKMSGYTSRANDLAIRVTKVSKLWQSGIDKMTNPVKQRLLREASWSDYIDSDEEEEITKAIGKALLELVEKDPKAHKQEVPMNNSLLEKYFAAGWRYRHGIGQFEDAESSCNDPGNGTELELADKRWCAVEEALQKLKDKLPTDWEPPLAPNEQVVFNPLFPVIPLPEMESTEIPYGDILMVDDTGAEPSKVSRASMITLPINIWARDDDVGLIWQRPIEPVLPSLISLAGEPVLGGTYPEPPPEPEPEEGICSHPIGARGYLCRKMPNTRCPYPQEKSEGDEDDKFDEGDAPLEITIDLTACEHPGAQDGDQNTEITIRQSESGPNICTQGGWRSPTGEDNDTPQEDPDLVPDDCSNCVVDLYCGGGDTCPGGETAEKEPSGRIPICIGGNDELPVPATYVIIHELIHAQQICNMPPNTPLSQQNAKDCCSLEYYPYLISCKAMADDGNFEGFDVTIEECAYAFANTSCSGFGENACTGGISYDEEILKQLEEIVTRNVSDVPAGCAEALESSDGRIASLKETLKRSCRPGCTVKYENTIGNNLCYLGQCIEESIEEHRLIPGNMPFTTGDQRSPWDSCEEPDPQIAALTTVPPHTPSKIPTYNPRQVLQHMETAICQTNGFPRLSPPVLCATPSRFNPPLEGYTDTLESLLTRQYETAVQGMSMETSLGNVATRFGTQIHNAYLDKAIRELADLVGAARKIVEQIGTVPMTKTMCPRFHIGEENEACTPFEYAN